MEFRQQSDEPTARTGASPGVPEQRPAPPVPVSGPRPAPPPGGPVRSRRGWSKLRLVLVVLAGMLSLLCVGGIGVGFVLYDQATKVDRSAPDVVVSSYLRGVFVQRDDTTAALYACSDQSGLVEVTALKADIQAREKEHGITIRVSWGALQVQADGQQATVTTEVTRTISDGSESDVQRWQFDLVDEDGWRVCGARRL